MRVVGIDLAGNPNRDTGIAVLSRRSFRTATLHEDEEIIELCSEEDPSIVAIDAPLTMPSSGNLRRADVELIKMGFRVFPPTFGGMLSLTNRGIQLSNLLRLRKIKIIEIHPRTSGLILFGTNRREAWLRELRRMGFRFGDMKSRHEVDACMAALTGWLHLRGFSETVGDPREGEIVIPLPPTSWKRYSSRSLKRPRP
ncbi:MAG: DUF429 domain-containing protein [Candidatus Hadarchaeales archaeon]